MARIRAIKPEFWSSPGIETIPMDARLLFIAMWNWADDSGVGVANPRELLGFAFPLDEEISVAELRRMLVEIHRVFGVKFYSVAGRRYYFIPSWEKHQKFDRRSKGKHPGPDHPDAVIEDEEGPAQDNNQDSPPNTRGNPTSTRSDSVAGSRNSVIGEGGTGSKDLDQTKGSIERATRFDEFWDTYPRKVGKQKARTKYTAAVKRAGDEQTVIDGAHALAQDPNLPETRFIPHPTTWLERDGWEDEPLPPRDDSNNPFPQSAVNSPEAWGAPSAAPQHPEIDKGQEAFSADFIDHQGSPF